MQGINDSRGTSGLHCWRKEADSCAKRLNSGVAKLLPQPFALPREQP